jgi:hypothetical protein
MIQRAIFAFFKVCSSLMQFDNNCFLTHVLAFWDAILRVAGGSDLLRTIDGIPE